MLWQGGLEAIAVASNDAMNMPEQRVLGAAGMAVPAMGIGTDSWGEALLGYNKRYGSEDLYEAYRACLDRGFNFFDTAEGYARGESEAMLGRFRKQDGRPVLIATKFDNPTVFSPPFSQFSPAALLKSLDCSLVRLGAERIDLYQIHFAVPRKSIDEYAEVLAQTVQSGKVRTVGVSNFNAPLMRAMHASLAARGIPLASNQVMFSLLSRYPEVNGVLEACRELNIALIAYIPLALGILTGKYRNGQTRPGGFQKVFFRIGELDLFREHGPERKPLIKRFFSKPRALGTVEPVLSLMEEIGDRHGKSVAQVALNWLLSTDPLVIPIPGAKNARQAQENIGAAGWRLTQQEYESISGTEIATR